MPPVPVQVEHFLRLGVSVFTPRSLPSVRASSCLCSIARIGRSRWGFWSYRPLSRWRPATMPRTTIRTISRARLSSIRGTKRHRLPAPTLRRTRDRNTSKRRRPRLPKTRTTYPHMRDSLTATREIRMAPLKRAHGQGTLPMAATEKLRGAPQRC
jgi:hypothetical protein